MVLSQSRASGNSGDELGIESSVQPATGVRTCHPTKPVMFTMSNMGMLIGHMRICLIM
jgi:hypothetical protein